MPFAEVLFDTGYIIYGGSGGPSFDTGIVTLRSGHENRNKNWAQDRGKWEYGERKCSEDELNTIINFFNARNGKFQGFRFLDRGNYKAEGTQGIVNTTGLGDGTAVGQLYRQYASGVDTYKKKIRKPVAGTVTIYKNGAVLASAVVDTTTGSVTFATPYPTASDALTWVGQFHLPVRFDTDHLRYRFDSAEVLSPGTLGKKYFYLFSLPLVEIRTD